MDQDINYEDAIMDCCKKHDVLKEFRLILNKPVNTIMINGAYRLLSVNANSSDTEKNRILRFYANETENFPGVEFINDSPLEIVEVDEKTNDKNFLYAEIIFTFHEDTEQWTGFIHLWNLNGDFNKLERITEVSCS